MEENIQEFEERWKVPMNFTGKCKIKEDGTVRYYLKGSLHRLDGPALEYPDGSKFWCKQGAEHRLDGPAVEYADGTIEWWVKGCLYSEEEFNALPKVIAYKMHKEGLGMFL